MRFGGKWLAMAGLAAAAIRADGAPAAEITALCSNGLRAVLEEVAPEFERSSGHKLTIQYGLAAAFKRQIDAGETFDLVVLTPPLLDGAIKDGKAAGDTRTLVGRA